MKTIKIKDIPEELIDTIRFWADNGVGTYFTDESQLKASRERAIEAIKEYKRIKRTLTKKAEQRKIYSDLLKKIEGR